MEQNDFEVRDIATYNPTTVPKISTVGDTLSTMKENDYTVVAVAGEEKNIVGYVRRDRIRDTSGSVDIKGKWNQINVNNIIYPATGFKKTVNMLANNLFYFIGDKENIRAIVTRADLNTKPVRNYLFRELLDFEELLDGYIHENIDNWFDRVGKQKRLEITDRYERAKEKDIQLQKIKYANFSTKMDIIYQDDNSRRKIGFGNKPKNDIKELISLRNDVAHGHPIIHSTSDRLEVDKRNTTDLEVLIDIVDRIEEKLEREV